MIEADVFYADPPYPAVMSYEREYKIIDEILEGASRPTSPFTAKGGAAMLDTLFERATHIPIWLLSLGNAVVGIEELEGKMIRFGRTTRAIAVRYQHLPAVATAEKKRENREFLVVGWDVEAPLLAQISVQSVREAARLDHSGAIAAVHDDPGMLRAESAAAEAGAGDLLKKREPSFAEQVASVGRDAVPEPERGTDDPNSVISEAGLNGDAERPVVSRLFHRRDIPLGPAGESTLQGERS